MAGLQRRRERPPRRTSLTPILWVWPARGRVRPEEQRTTPKGHISLANELQGLTVAILAADGVEQVELVEPRRALTDAGARVVLLSIQAGEIQAMNQDIEPADTFTVEQEVSGASVADYDGLVLPGGTVNPDHLRLDEDVVGFVRDFVQSGTPVAAICHGPWTLVEAGVVDGRTLTSYPSIRTDIRNAGGIVVDQEVAVDGNLITSRNPDDLPVFCSTIVSALAGAKV